MKKSLFALSLALLGNAFAMDLISIATNGAFNENSLGVKTLNDQEMSEVVGGLYEIGNNVISPSLVSKYYIVQNSDLNNDSWLMREATGMLYYGEVLVYAKRYYQSRIEQTWLIAYNPSTGYMRDLSLSAASSKTLQVLNYKYKY